MIPTQRPCSCFQVDERKTSSPSVILAGGNAPAWAEPAPSARRAAKAAIMRMSRTSPLVAASLRSEEFEGAARGHALARAYAGDLCDGGVGEDDAYVARLEGRASVLRFGPYEDEGLAGLRIGDDRSVRHERSARTRDHDLAGE